MDDDDNYMKNGDLDDSQFDEEAEATKPITTTIEHDTFLYGTQPRQQQQQHQQSQLDATEEASRALSQLQLQGSGWANYEGMELR